MNELSLDKAKQIVLEAPRDTGMRSRDESLLKFTLLMKEAEVLSVPELDRIGRSGNDLVHLSGLHKMKYSPCKADELRWFWGQHWDYLGSIPQVRDYIIATCETGYRAGTARHPWGLFNRPMADPEDYRQLGQKPWRTPEWLAAYRDARRRKAPEPLTEFYPYIAAQPTEEHEFLCAVDALVPRYLPNQTRADVCQDMIVAILSGDVTLDNLKDGLPKYLKQFLKGAPSKYGHLSLDAPAGYGDERTLGQRLGL